MINFLHSLLSNCIRYTPHQSNVIETEDINESVYSKLKRENKVLNLQLKEEQQKSQDLIDNIDNNLICIICFNNIKNVLISPCNHICVCDTCRLQIKKCPLCRVKMESYCNVYL